MIGTFNPGRGCLKMHTTSDPRPHPPHLPSTTSLQSREALKYKVFRSDPRPLHLRIKNEDRPRFPSRAKLIELDDLQRTCGCSWDARLPHDRVEWISHEPPASPRTASAIPQKGTPQLYIKPQQVRVRIKASKRLFTCPTSSMTAAERGPHASGGNGLHNLINHAV